jgi:hypothetical protein
MSLDVTLVTPTRDRPEAFALCQQWMARQTLHRMPVSMQWLVIDDGDSPANCTMGQEHIRRAPSPSVNTLPQNLIEASRHIKGSKILIIEDDDHYGPLYLEEMLWRLERAEIVGEVKARYYNVRERRWGVMDNDRHASLCRTGFSASLLPIMVRASEMALKDGDPFVDLRLWGSGPPTQSGMKPANILPKEARQDKFLHRGLSTGIKGMPGRGGLGGAHRSRAFQNYDPQWAKLVEWIGPDARDYMALATSLGWAGVP